MEPLRTGEWLRAFSFIEDDSECGGKGHGVQRMIQSGGAGKGKTDRGRPETGKAGVRSEGVEGAERMRGIGMVGWLPGKDRSFGHSGMRERFMRSRFTVEEIKVN